METGRPKEEAPLMSLPLHLGKEAVAFRCLDLKAISSMRTHVYVQVTHSLWKNVKGAAVPEN